MAKKVASKKKGAAPKKAVKKAATKAKTVKNVVKTESAFMRPLAVSATLAAVVGKGPMARSEVVKKLWVYIKKNGLQDQKNKRNINADVALKAVFGGKGTVNMFEMTKLVSKHLG